MIAYKEKDLQKIQGLIDNAKILVKRDIEDMKIEDGGSCVLGNGIQIYFVPKRCRNPIKKIIVDGPFQGNVSNYKALKNALDYLRQSGVDCRYEDGILD